MNLVTKLKLAKHFIHWRLTWDKRDTHYAYTLPDNPKFMGPRDAVRQCIKDGDVLGITGLGANMRPSILYWAMRELFHETGKPENLTIIAPGGFGGRGKVPGTPEEIGLEGLVTRFFSGHMETFKSMLRLGDQGKVELQCIPQGAFILLLAAMADGAADFATEAGVGTVIDPRCGRGTPVLGDYPQYVEAADHALRFHCPTLDVTLFNAPAADKKGNIYVRRCAMLGESHEMARLAKQNNGRVIVNVGKVVEEGYDEIFLPADMVDAVVYYPKTEQTGSVYHRKPWLMFTTESQTPLEEGIEQVRFINRLIGVTPKRSEVDNVTARLAASVFAEYMHKDALVNFGVGLPEEVSRLLLETGVFYDITGFTESGVFGGVAAPGVFFGAGVNPKEIVSSAEAFRRMYDHLDATVLGFLQVDSQGNINVSKRGEGAINYVGPGGFVDITTCADHVFFIGTWMANADMEIVDGKLKISKPGPIKFVEQVDEVTFNGAEALRRGQKIFYITNVGAFKLTERGVELVRVMPGIDIQKDIIEPCSMTIVLPEDGHVPEVDPRTISGKDYKLSLEMKPRADAPA
ncbi:MAG: CoA-transferase [Candidatus Hydrogenedentota bacterium]